MACLSEMSRSDKCSSSTLAQDLAGDVAGLGEQDLHVGLGQRVQGLATHLDLGHFGDGHKEPLRDLEAVEVHQGAWWLLLGLLCPQDHGVHGLLAAGQELVAKGPGRGNVALEVERVLAGRFGVALGELDQGIADIEGQLAARARGGSMVFAGAIARGLGTPSGSPSTGRAVFVAGSAVPLGRMVGGAYLGHAHSLAGLMGH